MTDLGGSDGSDAVDPDGGDSTRPTDSGPGEGVEAAEPAGLQIRRSWAAEPAAAEPVDAGDRTSRPTRSVGGRLALVVPLAFGVVALAIGASSLASASDREDAAQAELAATEDLFEQATSDQERVEDELNQSIVASRRLDGSAKDLVRQASSLSNREQQLLDLARQQLDAFLGERVSQFNALLDREGGIIDGANTSNGRLVDALLAFGRGLSSLPTTPCPVDLATDLEWVAYGGGLECAVLEVPLDHDDPDGEQIALHVARRPANDPDRAIGPLVVNPGGPGGSGLDLVRSADVSFPEKVLDRFDIVGFDPRGVGRSTPVDCGSDLDPLFAFDGDTEEAEIRAAFADFTEGCERRSGGLLEHLTTDNTARDIDRIRDALGVDQISYLGYSYGTFIGALYADMFPDRVRSAVLDGAVPPSVLAAVDDDDEEEEDEDSRGSASEVDDESIELVLDSCRAEEFGPCPLDAPLSDLRELRDLMAAGDLEANGLTLSESMLEVAVNEGFRRGAPGVRQLVRAIAAGLEGRGGGIYNLFAAYEGRFDNGTYRNSFESFYGTRCVDQGNRLTVEELGELRAEAVDGALLTGRTPVFLAYPCALWPVEPDPPAENLEGAPDAGPIMVVGSEGDPVTPVEDARELADQLDTAELLVYQGFGHTVVFSKQSFCVDATVATFLLDGADAEPKTCVEE